MKVTVIASTKENYVATKEEFDMLSGHSAGVCYMPDNFEKLFGEPTDKTIKRSVSTKARQHHSVFGHPFITFSLEDIPKALAMVLNNEGIYNTSEKSARYTKMNLKPDEQALYDKWLNKYIELIKDKYQTKYPELFGDKKIEKLAQENARYLISVFTPTSMIYTISYQQLNYLYQMLKNEVNSETSNPFMIKLKPAMKEFCEAIEGTPFFDSEIARGVENKNRKLSLFSKVNPPEEYFGDVYATTYEASFAELAQAQRHRTINYDIQLLNDTKFFVPPILKGDDNLIKEWLEDCKKQANEFPQGMLVSIREYGTMDHFIWKLKERKCSAAQLEINIISNDTLKKYSDALSSRNHPRSEELKAYTRGARCTFPDYTCPAPCRFKEGIDESRLI